MQTLSPAEARARVQWLRELARLWPVAKGSISVVRKPCTRPTCPACREGRRHPVALFTCRQEGRARCAYVPAGEVRRVRQALAHGREVERRLVEQGLAWIAAQRRRGPKGKGRAHPQS